MSMPPSLDAEGDFCVARSVTSDEYSLNVGAVLDVQAADLLAFRADWCRDELHAQDVAGDA
jgi:hypothetical protein